jgi:hypothetical protein
MFKQPKVQVWWKIFSVGLRTEDFYTNDLCYSYTKKPQSAAKGENDKNLQFILGLNYEIS